jgi:aspartyl-tRNA(Asn)/glutamyl-tRNA(Gln) amidotransferase subunit A
VRIGVPRALVAEGGEPDVRQALDGALATLQEQGAAIVDIDLPSSRHGIAAYYLIATAEASANLARYDGVRYGVRAPGEDRTLAGMYERTRGAGFGAEVKRRIMLGTYVLSAGYYEAYYRKAQQVRTLICREYDEAFARVDAIALPTSPSGAFRLGERTADPVLMYLADVFTVGANLAGVPAVTVPCGLTSTGLPIGLQLTGRTMDEATILRVAAVYERATDWHERQPAAIAGAPR